MMDIFMMSNNLVRVQSSKEVSTSTRDVAIDNGDIQYQKTLARPFTLSGVGLHSGLHSKVIVWPANAKTGRQFMLCSSPEQLPDLHSVGQHECNWDNFHFKDIDEMTHKLRKGMAQPHVFQFKAVVSTF